MEFNTCVNIVGLQEGALSMNPKDRGNWTKGSVGLGELKGTKYGISAASYPYLDIKNLKWEDALAIYKRDFWDLYGIQKLGPRIRLFVFDSMINHGPGVGVKLLQRALNIKDDGVLGPVTIARSANADPHLYALARSDYYVDIVRRDLPQLENLKGWLRRNLKILRESLTEK